jgi:hypothetical protein
MFSRKPRALDDGEITYPGESFAWEEDGSVTERRRRREHRGRAWAAFTGVALALLILGAQTGIFSSPAAGRCSSALSPRLGYGRLKLILPISSCLLDRQNFAAVPNVEMA